MIPTNLGVDVLRIVVSFAEAAAGIEPELLYHPRGVRVLRGPISINRGAIAIATIALAGASTTTFVIANVIISLLLALFSLLEGRPTIPPGRLCLLVPRILRECARSLHGFHPSLVAFEEPLQCRVRVTRVSLARRPCLSFSPDALAQKQIALRGAGAGHDVSSHDVCRVAGRGDAPLGGGKSPLALRVVGRFAL